MHSGRRRSCSQDVCVLGGHFAKGLRAHNWNLVEILMAVIMIFKMQSDHKFAHVMTAKAVMTCEKLWLDQIIIFEARATLFLRDLDYELMHLWCNGSLGATICEICLKFINLAPGKMCIHNHFLDHPVISEFCTECMRISLMCSVQNFMIYYNSNISDMFFENFYDILQLQARMLWRNLPFNSSSIHGFILLPLTSQLLASSQTDFKSLHR